MTSKTASEPANNAADAKAANNEAKSEEEVKKETATTEEAGEGKSGPTSPTKKAKEPKPTVHKGDFEKDVVYLYQFTRCPVIPSPSPFCLNVETWLRMAGIKYEVGHLVYFFPHCVSTPLY